MRLWLVQWRDYEAICLSKTKRGILSMFKSELPNVKVMEIPVEDTPARILCLWNKTLRKSDEFVTGIQNWYKKEDPIVIKYKRRKNE